MFNLFKRVHIKGDIFNGHFVDVKAFYVAQFNKIPSLMFIGEIDTTKAFAFVTETFRRDIAATYQHSYFNHNDNQVYFNNTIVVLNNERVIEIAGNYCQVLHGLQHYGWARQLVNDLAAFRIAENDAPSFRHTNVVGFARETTMN